MGLLIIMAVFAAESPYVQAHPPVVADLVELDQVIGVYPPNINSEQERKDVEQKYDAALSAVNEQLKAKPGDAGLLVKRGCIERLGHNLDRPGTFEAAEKDLLAVLQKDPKHEGALVELGTLYVNYGFELAPKAEDLFKRAQKAHGEKLFEPAQNGLFFAYYMQARMKEALGQAELLSKTWPDKKEYAQRRELVQGVLDRAEKGNKQDHANADAKSTSDKADEAYARKEYKEAFRLFTEAAQKGDAKAEYFLGVMYRDGEGMEQDYGETIEWFRKAAEHRFPLAYNDLAWVYATCKDARFRDGKKAVEWALKAADVLKKYEACFDTLAAAYARDGQFAKAVETQEKAITMLKQEQGMSETEKQKQITDSEKMLILYKNNTAYIDEEWSTTP